MSFLRRIGAAVAATAGILAATAPSMAETDWPNRAVTVIVPFPAGGGTDPVARLIFDDLSKRLGKPFPLDFRAGAVGTIGTRVAAAAEPDGYTMLFTSSSPLVNANFMANVAYNPKTDLIPVIQATAAPYVIAANINTPYNTFQELIDYAKANPGKVNAAFSGVGGNSHFLMANIAYKTGVNFNIVPYQGAGAQQADLLSGVVDIGVGFAAGFLPGVQSGKLKYIAVTAGKRNANLPNVQSTDESTYKGVYGGGWFMALAPKGTPREIVDKMNAEITKTLSQPEIQKKIEDLGNFVVTGTPEDARKRVETDTAEMKLLVDAGVFKLE